MEVSQVRELLAYDAESGKLTWRDVATDSPQRRSKYAGKEAFTSTDDRGYKQGRLSGKKHYAHRVAWALHYGEWPVDQVDHINGDRSDNRISNLRAATQKQNSANRRTIRGSSGYLGVSWHVKAKKWTANIQKDGFRIYLGVFDRERDAADAYSRAARELHGEFAAA